jgi:hypothetical protein
MGLSLVFDEGLGAPGMSDGSNNRLSARVDMDVLDNNPLLSATTKFGQRVDLRGKGFCQAGDHKAI